MFLKKGLLLITALALLAFVGQASAGPNANAVLSLDIDASDNKMDDGNTSGTVVGAGTDVVVEVFISGLAGPIKGGVLSFDTDMLTVKSEGVKYAQGIGQLLVSSDTIQFFGTDLLNGVSLSSDGYLTTVTLTTASDVTGMEFKVGASVNNLAAATGETDMLTAAVPLTFNASTPPPMPPMPPDTTVTPPTPMPPDTTVTPPTPMPPDTTATPLGPALDIDNRGNGMKDGRTSRNAEAGGTVVVEVFAGEDLSPIGGGSITFSQAITGDFMFADGLQILGPLEDGGKKIRFSGLTDEGLVTLNDQGYLGSATFTVATVPATISVEELSVIYASGVETPIPVDGVEVMIEPPTLVTMGSMVMVEVPYDGSAMTTVTAVGFAEGSAITFNVDPMDAVETSQDGAKLTLTASGSATVTVTASKGDFTTEAVTIVFEKGAPPFLLTASEEMVTIPRGESAMITLTASGFAEGADIAFDVKIDGTVQTIRQEQQGAMLTLTASGPGSASVTVTASVGEMMTAPITVAFNAPPPELMLDVESPVTVPRDTSVTVTVTTIGFPAGADIAFVTEVDGSVKVAVVRQENGVLMLTASGSGSSNVTVTASSGEMMTAPLTIEFVEQPPELMASANMIEIPYDSSAMVTVTAVGFAEGADVVWTVEPADAVDVLREGAMLTLTATSAATVTVTAEVGEKSAEPITIEFTEEVVPLLMTDTDMPIVTVPRGGTAMATVTAMNFAADATITFDVTVEGSAMVEHSQDGATLTLTASGLGSSVVTVTATDGTFTTKAFVIQFDEQVAVELSSFVGEVVEERVVLNWATASQTNNAGFRVLRSTDRENYDVVSELIAGAGTTDQLMDYTFEDASLPAVERVYYVLEQIDIDGTVHRSNPIEVMLGARFLLPTEFSSSVYPNPFNPSTTISYDLPSNADVSIVIYDAIGQEIRQLVSEYRAAGRYSVRWDATDHRGRSVGSGVYIAKIKAGQHTALQKMLLLK